MVQKRPYSEEKLYEVSSKQPRHVEPSTQLVSFLQFPCESVAPNSYTSGGDEEKFSEVRAFSEKRPDSCDVTAVPVSSEKAIETSIHGSASNSSWTSSSTSEEDIRSEVPFHVLTASKYYSSDPPFRVVIHPMEVYSPLFNNPPRKSVPIGPDFQAELPEWGAYDSKNISVKESTQESSNLPSQALESDFVDHHDEENKLAGTCIIPMPKLESPADHEENVGAGRIGCSCGDAGSFGCVRLHIMEAREKLKAALALGKNFWDHLAVEFPSRSKRDLVSYYFNVFILRKRAKQNRFDPSNIDSDNDEWQEIDDDVVATGAQMTDDDEDSVVESPIYQNYPGHNEIYVTEKQAYDEEAGVATLEDYQTINFCRRKVLSDVSKACPDELIDNNSSCGHNIQPLDRHHSNEVGNHDVEDNSCTTDAAGASSDTPQVKTDDCKHWASHFAGVGIDSGHDFVMEPSNGKEWDMGGYLSCPKNEVDLLPTCSMIEEVFGDEAWSSKHRDGHSLSKH
uniref:Myb-like domain-containing protein n=1 Tax=Solanum lycopersicum TaxID=4081 RepID=A0A3Q7GXL2_SOLLC